MVSLLFLALLLTAHHEEMYYTGLPFHPNFTLKTTYTDGPHTE